MSMPAAIVSTIPMNYTLVYFRWDNIIFPDLQGLAHGEYLQIKKVEKKKPKNSSSPTPLILQSSQGTLSYKRSPGLS